MTKVCLKLAETHLFVASSHHIFCVRLLNVKASLLLGNNNLFNNLRIQVVKKQSCHVSFYLHKRERNRMNSLYVKKLQTNKKILANFPQNVSAEELKCVIGKSNYR